MKSLRFANFVKSLTPRVLRNMNDEMSGVFINLFIVTTYDPSVVN